MKSSEFEELMKKVLSDKTPEHVLRQRIKMEKKGVEYETTNDFLELEKLKSKNLDDYRSVNDEAS